MQPLPAPHAVLPNPGPAQIAPQPPQPNQLGPPGGEDLRKANWIRRRNLAMGLLLRIISGPAILKVPLSLFCAASRHASRIDYSDPAGPNFVLIPIHPGPISYLVEWLRKVVTENKALYLALTYDLTKDLAIVRAGKMLGLDFYVQDMFNHWWRHFKKAKMVYEEIEIVLSLTTSKQDSFFICVADRLAMMKYKDWKWHGFDDFDEWITRHPWLHDAVKISLAQLHTSNRNAS